MKSITISETFKFRSAAFCLLLLCLLLVSPQARAQTDDPKVLRATAFKLIEEQKFTEALPLLEKLAAVSPADPAVQKNLGFALLGQAKNTADSAAAKRLRARARAAFVRARDAGDDSQFVGGMIDSIPPDGGEESGFTSNTKANELMQRAEAAFSAGKMDEALDLYQSALKLDPSLYYAALFSGDVYMHKQKYEDAEIWYQRAISIDPNIETAYRYSATPLMKQKKYAQARDRYVEAYIIDPYNRLALSGIVQWGQATGTNLGHPNIKVPETTIGADGKSKTTINVNPMPDDGSMAWVVYAATREAWKKEKFAKTFPGEKVYRHSVAEEADAFRSVVKSAKEMKAKNLSEELTILDKLDQEGLLEAFILMAMADKGIAQDHREYLRTNRDKLRQYVVKYVIGGK